MPYPKLGSMRRRDFITLVGGAVAAGCPLGALAQQPIRPAGKTPHVGVLMPGPTAHSTAVLGPFYQGLHDLGYTRPGGNVTGTTFLGPELVPKRLQLLRDIVPGLARVAALWHPHAYGEHTMANIVKDVEQAARTLGIQLQLVPADGPDDIASAFSTIAKERADAF